MLKFVCLIVLVVGACTAKTSEFPEENSTDDGRIFGGSEARRGQFPHQVSLRRNNGRTHFCGGTILSGHIILTAGQCTHKMRPQNLRIVVGTLRVFGDGRQYAIFKIMNHPNFHLRSLANDISVLRTTLRIRFSNYVRSIPLPTTDVAIAGNFNASHSGWGQFRPGSPSNPQNFPNMLQWKATVTMSRQDCSSRLGSNGRFVFPNTICTSNPITIGSCRGDAGSPLISENLPRVIIGVASWRIQCARGFPDVYARVHPHLPFIRASMDDVN